MTGLLQSAALNCIMAISHFRGKKVVVYQIHAANQMPHIEPLLAAFQSEHTVRQIVLCPPDEMAGTRDLIEADVLVRSYNTTFFLLFWHIVVAVDQRMRLPLLNPMGGKRICIFHGQPTKGNVYARFNHRYLDALFFYGPMMRSYYLRQKAEHPEWSVLETYDVGQAKSDALFQAPIAEQKRSAKERLAIAQDTQVVLYAPSFEPCASLAMQGEAIIRALYDEQRALLVKPHPSFYRVVDPADAMYEGVPHASAWAPLATELVKTRRVIFPIDDQIDTETALGAADVLVTDHSGIAFDAITIDLPVIFIDCPDFFEHYLPERYGIDGQAARLDIACNAGRDAGTVVQDCDSLVEAVIRQLADPGFNEEARARVRETLLFNQGVATEAIKQRIKTMIQ